MRISPTKSTLNRKIPFTVHNDAPVVPPDMIRLLWSTTNRKTRSGKVLGEEQKISTYSALEAMTINAAFQHFEDDIKGSINKNDIYLVSALKNDGVRVFLDGLISKIPKREWEFPANRATNISDKFLAEEFTRERILYHVHKEIPYSVIIETEKWDEKKRMRFKYTKIFT